MSWNIQTLWLCLGAAVTLDLMPSSPVDHESSATKGEAIHFKRSAWKAGDTITSKLNVDGTLTVMMSVQGEVVQHFDQTSHERTLKKSTVLAVGDDGPKKISVHYDEVAESQQGNQGEEPEVPAVSPLSGKTFVLEKTAKETVVTDEDGTVVGEDIAALVREKELSRDGSLEHGFDRLALLVSESPRKYSEKIEVPEEIALEIAGGDEDLKDAHMTIKLREVRDVDGESCAVFQAEIKLSGTASGNEYKTAIELSGEILIRIGGARFVSADLSGQCTLDGAVATENTTVTISGEGPLKIVESASYSHERS